MHISLVFDINSLFYYILIVSLISFSINIILTSYLHFLIIGLSWLSYPWYLLTGSLYLYSLRTIQFLICQSCSQA